MSKASSVFVSPTHARTLNPEELVLAELDIAPPTPNSKAPGDGRGASLDGLHADSRTAPNRCQDGAISERGRRRSRWRAAVRPAGRRPARPPRPVRASSAAAPP